MMELVADRFDGHFGDLEPFDYPVTAKDAKAYLDWFVAEALPCFGDWQDAMKQGEPLLFHSHLSTLINCGLLDPRECCEKAEQAYRDGKAPLNAVEGFIRQIIGWREFIRGVYWLKMPDYADSNALEATRGLPGFFWTGETQMNCLGQAISETRSNAYAHHIQRLMVIGNFCLIAGIDPKQVQEWFLIVYSDAYEWVEMPNVVGMAPVRRLRIRGLKALCGLGCLHQQDERLLRLLPVRREAEKWREGLPLQLSLLEFPVREREGSEEEPPHGPDHGVAWQDEEGTAGGGAKRFRAVFRRPRNEGMGRIRVRLDQLQPLEARVAVLADDDVVMDRDPKRAGGLDDQLGHLDIGA
jgi:diadenosine tetraphosphatase ApaH/serine/threonine PP2A family protein phosphatase